MKTLKHSTNGGSGVTIGLVIAIMIFGKREDNKAIATLSLVPGLFNINETVTFGIPMVLNPILGIPFVVSTVIYTPFLISYEKYQNKQAAEA